MDRLWVAWEIHRRNRTTSRALGFSLFEVTYQLSKWLRYPLSIIKTLRIFLREKPKVIVAQNPSIILALVAVWYGCIVRVPVVIDAHNAGINPFFDRKRWANVLAKHIMCFATLTVVTNEPLANYVVARGGRSFVLPDPLPKFESPPSLLPLQGNTNVLFICTWSEDEPYMEVIKAASRLDKTICIYITGNGKGKVNTPLPANIVLTGFLDEADYVTFLFSSDIIMDLTTRDNCLVCGAYEAVAAEKPVILSDWAVLKEYFYKGAVYTDNSADDIASKILIAIENHNQLTHAVRELKIESSSNWLEKQRKLNAILQQLIRLKDV